MDRVADDTATDKVYGAQGSEKIAKDFLADKGLKPTPTDVAIELITKNKQTLVDEVAKNADLQTAVAENEDLQEAVANHAGLQAAVATIPALQTAVAQNEGLQAAVAAIPDLHTAVAGIPALQNHVLKISITSPEFKQAVQKEMSQLVFDIPTDDSAPISTDW